MSCFSVATEDDPVFMLSGYVAKNYEARQYTNNEETWPPDPSTFYMESTLMYHQGQYNSEKESSLIVKLMQTGLNYEQLQHVLNSTQLTKNITDIFANLDTQKCEKEFILIEGASGMGKSIL